MVRTEMKKRRKGEEMGSSKGEGKGSRKQRDMTTSYGLLDHGFFPYRHNDSAASKQT